MSDPLSNILLKLITEKKFLPAGDKGFEGLIAELLEILTQRHFYLAKSGYQEGRDMSSRDSYQNVIAIECKRYRNTTSLDERELLGELDQVKVGIPDLDIWVLITSRDVDSKLYESLQRNASQHGIDFAVIASGDGEPSSLAVLCTNSPATVTKFLKPVALDEDLQKLEDELDKIANHPQFSQKVNRLREKFLSPLVGYENWRVEQNRRLLNYFKSEKDSRAVFGQSIDVEGDKVRYVERTELTKQLNSWYSTWGKNKNIFAVLGEEGDGKTWGIARWLGQKIQQGNNFPGVVFISSNQATTNNPYQLFSEVIARNFTNLTREQCHYRIKRWTNRTTDEKPILLLVLDGINERQDFQWWRSLIDCLVASPWCNSVAVVITCRDRYWQSTFGKLRYLSTNTYKLPSYSEEELTEALKTNNIDRRLLSSNLFNSELIYKPRYCDLVIKHQEKIGDVGKITVPRLIYEDRKDRLDRNSNISITDDNFQQIIKDLAEKAVEKAKNKFKKQEIEETFSFVSNKMEIFKELWTGGVLQEKRGSYEVKENFFTYGFGLLLVDNLADAAESGEVNLEEVMAQWLEPNAGMDIKGEICHFASLISLGDTDIPLKVKVTLLLAWVNSQNPNKDIDSDFIEYLPLDPDAYINLAEIVWSDKTENPWAQELLIRAFIHWQDNEQVVEKLIPKLEQWLGFVHLYGFPHPRRACQSDREIEQIREDICQCVGQQLEPGQTFTFNGYQLTAIDDDGLLRLGRVALRIIDYLPVKPFIRGIATGATSEAIMGFTLDYRDKNDLFQWIFASADDNLWNKIKLEVESLKAANNLIANRVAYFLLSWEGSTEAFELQKTLPDDLFPANPYYEKYKQNPCKSFFYRWSESDCLTCLTRKDITIQLIAEKLTPHCINPELKVPDSFKDRLSALTEQISIDNVWSTYQQNSDDIHFRQYEPALCAYAPDAIADLVRQIMRGIINRSEISLRQLCFKIKENYLVFGAVEKQAIYQIWQVFEKKCDVTGNLEQVAESRLFKIVLEQLEAEHQLDYLLQRSATASDWTSLEQNFKPLPNIESALLKLDRLSDDTTIQRTLWFLSAHQVNLTAEQIRQHIYPFLENENSFTISIAFKILYQSQDNNVIQHFINSSWQWNVRYHDLENHWGNLLLCQYGQDLSFSDLKNRVHPSFLGIAIRNRGMKSEEVEQYAEYINLLWTEIQENVPELPLDLPSTEIRITRDEDFTDLDMIYLSDKYFYFSETFINKDAIWGGIGSNSDYGYLKDFDERDETRTKLNQIGETSRKQQSKANNCFFEYKIPKDVLSKAIALRPDLVDKWLEAIQGEQSETARKIIRVGTLFYETLCYVLLERSHLRAIELYRYLSQNKSQIILKDARTNTRYLDYALFQASPTESLEREWLHRLENCYCDTQLMELAIVAQLGQGESWLLSRIERQLRSSAPGDFSQAVTMLGFLETDQAIEQLKNIAKNQPDTWRKLSMDISIERWQRNSWAKHWFREFLNQCDRIMAWRGFRLFLQCVDKRFWLWKEQLIAESSTHSFHQNYLDFLEDNEDTIKNAIRNSKYNQELDKTFLTRKTT